MIQTKFRLKQNFVKCAIFVIFATIVEFVSSVGTASSQLSHMEFKLWQNLIKYAFFGKFATSIVEFIPSGVP